MLHVKSSVNRLVCCTCLASVPSVELAVPLVDIRQGRSPDNLLPLGITAAVSSRKLASDFKSSKGTGLVAMDKV